MPFLLRTRLVNLEPEQIALTVQGKAHVRVRGNAYGWLRCGRERRWVWGAFDETFAVSLGALLARGTARVDRGGELRVSALGLGGFAQRTLRIVAASDLTLQGPPAVLPRMRWSAYVSPRLGTLSAAAIRRAEPR